MPKPTLVAAAAVAEAVKTLGSGAYVFSTRSKKVLNEENASAAIAAHKFSEHVCGDCTTSFHALTASSPFCFTCGSENVKKGAEVASLKIHPDSELTSITCSACGVSNVLPSVVSAAVQEECHCAACGTKLIHIQMSSEGDAAGDADSMEVVDIDAAADGETPEGEGDVTPSLEAEGEVQCQEGEVPPADVEDELDFPAEDAAEGEDDGEELDLGDSLSADADEMPMNDYSDVDVLDTIDEDATDDVNVLSMAGKVMLASGDRIFATLDEKQAGENASIMHTESFHTAVAIAIRNEGIRATVANFNFSPVVIKAKVSAIAKRKVEATVSKEVAAIEATRDQHVADFKQAIDIAAAGLNKGFWKGIDNPLKKTLVAELSAMNVRGAERIVAKLFEKAGLDYTTTLVKQARVLMDKSVAARNELADLLDMTGVLASDDEDEDEGPEAGEDFESAVAAALSEDDVAAIKGKTTQTAGATGISASQYVRSVVGSEPLFSH